MITKDWYIKNSPTNIDSYLNHFTNDLILEFEDAGLSNPEKPQYKNTIDLVFSKIEKDHFIVKEEKDISVRTDIKKIKVFGVNLNINQIEELIKQLKKAAKDLKLNSFKNKSL